MSREKSERLLNLHIMLLGARRFVPKEAIRRAHYAEYGYDERGEAAFERAFERDKDDLRAIGAVIEVGSDDPFFEDELGYRIPHEQTSLAEVRFTGEEAAVLGLAAQVWEQETVARAAGNAVAKLSALGVDVDPQRLDVVPSAIRATEPSFDAFWEATQTRREVRFGYRRPGQNGASRRRLQPWGMVRQSGRWYVTGFDVDRQDVRVFRLSRVEGAVSVTGKALAYEVPEGTDVRSLTANLTPQEPSVEVELLVRRDAAVGIRRHAREIVESVPGPDERTGWDLVRTAMREHVAADLVMAHGDAAYVVGPDSLREAVIARLRASLAGAR